MRISRSIRLGIQLALTFGFFLVELIVGITVNSLALISDSFHMLSDVLALAVAFYAIRVAKRTSTKHMSYGWARAEIVGAFANSVFLIALCFTLIIDGLGRLVSPEEVSNSLMLLIVGAAGLAVNLIGLAFFHEAGHGHVHSHGHSHGHGHGHKHKHKKHEKHESDETASSEQPSTLDLEANLPNKDKNMNMRGVFLHVLGDALGSIAVIAVGLILYLAPHYDWVVYLDPALSLLITALLLGGAIPLARQTANVLLHRVPQAVDVDAISEELKQVEGLAYLHEFHVWQMSDTMFVGSCHVIADPTADQMALIAKIKAVLHTHDIHETTVQIEPLSEGVEEQQCLLECEQDCHTKTCHPRNDKKQKDSASAQE